MRKKRETNWLKVAVLALLFNEAANYAAAGFMETQLPAMVWCYLTAVIYTATGLLVLGWWNKSDAHVDKLDRIGASLKGWPGK